MVVNPARDQLNRENEIGLPGGGQLMTRKAGRAYIRMQIRKHFQENRLEQWISTAEAFVRDKLMMNQKRFMASLETDCEEKGPTACQFDERFMFKQLSLLHLLDLILPIPQHILRNQHQARPQEGRWRVCSSFRRNRRVSRNGT